MTRAVVIVGTGRTVHDDLQKAALFEADYMAINCAGFLLPFVPFKHWVTWHADFFEFWPLIRGLRYENSEPEPIDRIALHTGRQRRLWPSRLRWKPPTYWPALDMPNSLPLAVNIALNGLEYDRALLAGCPVDGNGAFYLPSGMSRDGYGKAEGDSVLSLLERFKGDGRVKSFSGRTRELFGEPEQ